MGQTQAKTAVQGVATTVSDGRAQAIANQIPELKDVTLSGTMSVGKELGRGAYGKVYSVRYRENTFAAKEIHPLLIEGVNPEDREAIKNDFVKECLRCSSLAQPDHLRARALIDFIISAGCRWSGDIRTD